MSDDNEAVDAGGAGTVSSPLARSRRSRASDAIV
jgi:hypothetical protein